MQWTRLELDYLELACVSPGACEIRTVVLQGIFNHTAVITDIKSTLIVYKLTAPDSTHGISQSGLRDDALDGLNNVQDLYLTSNTFKPFPEIGYMQELRTLYLMDMQLVNADLLIGDNGGLHLLINLEDLRLGSNLLTAMPDIRMLTNITFLDLNNNAITSTNSNVLRALIRLESLKLKDNPIINVVDIPYHLMPAINQIDIRLIIAMFINKIK